ncbi:MAG: zf-HC2 domain-containing protein [Acidimicrobiales bacterium]
MVAGNQTAQSGDLPAMRCDTIREALSARLDGEAAGLDDEAIDTHLRTCGACQRWSEELATLHRMVRVREAEPVPDLTAAILGTPAASPRRRPRREAISPARWALFVVALSQLILAAPALLLGEDAGATVHVARELGSFDVALAVGLLVAAWQPARAWGLLPVIAALGLVMAGTAVVDVVRGTASGLGEAHHVLDLAGLALLWWVAREEQSSPVGRHRGVAIS